MWIYWLRTCNQQHKAAEEPFFPSYWNSGSRNSRVTQGIAWQLPVYGVPRAHALPDTALSGTIWPSFNTDMKGKNAIQISFVCYRLLWRTFLLKPQAKKLIETDGARHQLVAQFLFIITHTNMLRPYILDIVRELECSWQLVICDCQLVEALRYKPEGIGFDSWQCH
jgi:hypothetical protein